MSSVNPVFQKFLITLVFANGFKSLNALRDTALGIEIISFAKNTWFFVEGGTQMHTNNGGYLSRRLWIFTDNGKNFLCTYLIHIFAITSLFSVYVLTNDIHRHLISHLVYFVDLLVISGFLSYKFPLFKFGGAT